MLRESGVQMTADLQPSVLTAAGGEDSQSSMDSIDDMDSCLSTAPTRSCSDEEPGDQVRVSSTLTVGGLHA
jgi:hypothetical protein